MQKKHNCTACGNSFPRTAEFFFAFKYNKDGLRTQCKACHIKQTTDNAKNRPGQKEYQQNYWQKNKTTLKAKYKDYYRDKKDDICKTRVKYVRKRLETDPWFRALYSIRSTVRYAIKRGYSDKSRRATELIGCDFLTFKSHICRLFLPGMTWEKVLSGEIHLDHIIPCTKFDLTDKEQQKKCFNYTNTQPLWPKDNLLKRDSDVL